MKLGIITVLIGLVSAHGDHGSHGSPAHTRPDGLPWQKWHMLEEHRISEFAPEVFFTMHAKGDSWGREEILNLYGLKETMGDGSGMGEGKRSVTDEERNNVVSTILKLLDTTGNGQVTLEEWKAFKGDLPDFGYGSGHHLDFEAEYEEHHWKLYHANNDPDVLIKHKEDIEHDLLHHELEIEKGHGSASGEGWWSNIRLDQVPLKYRA